MRHMRIRRAAAVGLVAGLAGCLHTDEGVASRGLPSALEAGWDGSDVCALQHRGDSFRVLRCSFPPGVGHERHYHPPHFGFALSGGVMELTDASGTRRAEIATGSSYSSEGVDWHTVVNVGDTTVTYLIIEEF